MMPKRSSDRTFVGWLGESARAGIGNPLGVTPEALLHYDPAVFSQLNLPSYGATMAPLKAILEDRVPTFWEPMASPPCYAQLFPRRVGLSKAVLLDVMAANDVLRFLAQVQPNDIDDYDVLLSKFRTNRYGGIAVVGNGYAVVELAPGLQSPVAHGSVAVSTYVVLDAVSGMVSGPDSASEQLSRHVLERLKVPPCQPTDAFVAVSVGRGTYLRGYFEFAYIDSFANDSVSSQVDELIFLDARSEDGLIHQDKDRLADLLEPKGVGTSVIARGTAASAGSVRGVVVLRGENGFNPDALPPDAILVLDQAVPADIEAVIAAVGMVCTRGGITSHAAMLARSLRKPTIVGVGELQIEPDIGCVRKNGEIVLRTGDRIVLDADRGLVILE